MEHVIERNVFMAIGAWSVVILDKVHPEYPLWQVALGLCIGAALYCVLAWSRGGEC